MIEGSGDQFDHRIFKSKTLAEKKTPIEFPNKNKILGLMRNIELERNVFCYGKRKPADKIQEVIKNFQNLRRIINKILENATKK